MPTTIAAPVHRPYKYRVYPTPEQTAKLETWERQLRWLYNLCHEQRLMALGATRLFPRERGHCPSCGAALPKKKGDRPAEHTAACAWVDYYRQSREMTDIVRIDGRLASVVCCARQEMLRDLDKAWQRWRKGLGGRPRFKRRTDSVRIYFSTPKHWKVAAGAVTFAGMAAPLGALVMDQDRPFPGAPSSQATRRPGKKLSKARKAKLARRPVHKDPVFFSCHLVRDADEWYAIFPLVYSAEVPVPPPNKAVGINRGMVHAVADSDGRVVDSPAFYQRGLRGLKARARALARKVARGKTPKPAAPRYRMFALEPKTLEDLAARLHTSAGNVLYQVKKQGTLEKAVAYFEAHPPKPSRPAAPAPPSEGRNREYAVLQLARAHRTIRRQREWFLHEQSAYYARSYALIGIEDFSTRKMTTSERKPKGLPPERRNKQILDVGWYELQRQLEYKSAPAGGRVALVDPVNLSRIDSETGVVRKTPASGHAMWRTESGETLLGDVNAARNVLGRALAMPPPDAPKAPRVKIQIKGRAKAQTETAGKPPAEACGGDAPVRAPVEAGTLPREGGHLERTVLPVDTSDGAAYGDA